MGISNDWQVIDGLSYFSVGSTSNRLMNQASVTKMANAVSWEVIHLADYGETVSVRGTEISTTNIYLMKPSDNNDYDIAVSPLGVVSYTAGVYIADFIFRLSTCEFLGVVDLSFNSWQPTSCYLLRPTNSGAFAFKLTSSDRAYHSVYDKFYNAETNETKWGIVTERSNDSGTMAFADLYTGTITGSSVITQTKDNLTIKFISLKKLTLAFSSYGVYNSRIIYVGIVNYSMGVQVVELGGIKYQCMGRLYIPLAD